MSVVIDMDVLSQRRGSLLGTKIKLRAMEFRLKELKSFVLDFGEICYGEGRRKSLDDDEEEDCIIVERMFRSLFRAL